MSLFKNKNSENAPNPFISVNCDLQASISNRVDFNTQNIQFFEDDLSSRIGFIARSYENGFIVSNKGMIFVFPSDIETGSYKPTDSDFPFETLHYYELGANGDFSTSYSYKAESGTIDIEVISNDAQALRYLINFDFKGKDRRTEELHIKGDAELNVFMRAS